MRLSQVLRATQLPLEGMFVAFGIACQPKPAIGLYCDCKATGRARMGGDRV
jgi:hypothetical protein